MRGTVKKLHQLEAIQTGNFFGARTLSDAAIDAMPIEELHPLMAEKFKVNAALTAEGAADIIVDGVRGLKNRILVGEDAKIIDIVVRCLPEWCYTYVGYIWIGLAILIGKATRLGLYGLPVVSAGVFGLAVYFLSSKL